MNDYEEVNAKAYIQGLKDGKEIGRADAIDEFADNMQLVKLVECEGVPRELIEAIEKQIGICALRVKEKMLKEQKNE